MEPFSSGSQGSSATLVVSTRRMSVAGGQPSDRCDRSETPRERPIRAAWAILPVLLLGHPGTSLTAKETVPSNLATGVVQSVAVDAATPNAHPRPNAFGNAVLAWATNQAPQPSSPKPSPPPDSSDPNPARPGAVRDVNPTKPAAVQAPSPPGAPPEEPPSGAGPSWAGQAPQSGGYHGQGQYGPGQYGSAPYYGQGQYGQGQFQGQAGGSGQNAQGSYGQGQYGGNGYPYSQEQFGWGQYAAQLRLMEQNLRLEYEVRQLRDEIKQLRELVDRGRGSTAPGSPASTAPGSDSPLPHGSDASVPYPCGPCGNAPESYRPSGYVPVYGPCRCVPTECGRGKHWRR